MARITTHLESLPVQPTMNVDDATIEFSRSLIEPMPRSGMPFEEILALLFERCVPASFNAASPGYLAYIPGGGIVHAAIADLIADTVNRYTGVFVAAPALVQLETNVIRWLREIVGMPAGAGGILTSGGSLANLTAIITAREARLGEDFGKAVLYCSDQVHHSFQKAARLAGFRREQVREIASDAAFHLDLDALRAAIRSDRQLGMQPFLVVGSAGTVGTGAVDDLAAIAAIAGEESLWFHVDGAYGAFFAMTDRGRRRLQGIGLADSVILDPHKTLFLPYGTGALLVRDIRDLRTAHSSHAAYLPAMQENEDFIDFCEVSPELSRDFRGLRVWLPLKMFGIDAFRDQLDEKLDLIEYATEQLRTIDGIEIIAEPELTIVAFRYIKPGLDESSLNALNREIIDRVNARGRVMLTPTILGERFVIRICIVSFRTHRDRIDMAIEDIRAAVQGS